jgi:vacuolar-type H+-ATPase subunit F/Vma7
MEPGRRVLGDCLSVVAVAETPLFEALRLIGVNVVKPPSETGNLLELLAKCKVLVVEGSVYRKMRGELEQMLEKLAEPPLLVVAPSKVGEETERFEEISRRVYAALGVTGR